MNEKQFNTEPGTRQNFQPSQNTRTDYENPAGDDSTTIDDYERATPQEFPEHNQQHDYKNPSANQTEDDEDESDTEDEADTDGEIFNQDDEDEATDPVDDQSLERDDPDHSGMRR